VSVQTKHHSPSIGRPIGTLVEVAASSAPLMLRPEDAFAMTMTIVVRPDSVRHSSTARSPGGSSKQRENAAMHTGCRSR